MGKRSKLTPFYLESISGVSRYYILLLINNTEFIEALAELIKNTMDEHTEKSAMEQTKH